MIKEIIKLIGEAKKTEEFSWLSQINLESARFIVREKALPLQRIKNVYSRRGKTNKITGESIIGFNRLLNKLNNSKVKFISMHEMVDNEGFEYLIFTDSNLKELIGVLKFPQK